MIAAYYEACAELGFGAPDVFGCATLREYRERHPEGAPVAPGFLMLSRDPEATWREIARHAEYDARTYAAWQEDGVVSDWAVPGAHSWRELRASGRYAVVTAEQAVALAERDGSLMLHPLMGGIAPALAWKSLELFEAEVLPRLHPR